VYEDHPLKVDAMALDLAKITELFLTPSSILVAALGVARTDPLKTGISGLGFVLSILWINCSRGATAGESSMRAKILEKLPVIFIFFWVFSTIVHALLWANPPSSASSLPQ
jgi:hypothetical protein